MLTGNDDYVLEDNDDDTQTRRDYNAAILFSEHGQRLKTYRKIRLVPFIEYFPYDDAFPWLLRILMHFDITFWTPGDEYTVFDHPKAKFSTPICFEDTFPSITRAFVRGGCRTNCQHLQ